MSELVFMGKRADDMTKEELIAAMEKMFTLQQAYDKRQQEMIDTLMARLYPWKI